MNPVVKGDRIVQCTLFLKHRYAMHVPNYQFLLFMNTLEFFRVTFPWFYTLHRANYYWGIWNINWQYLSVSWEKWNSNAYIDVSALLMYWDQFIPQKKKFRYVLSRSRHVYIWCVQQIHGYVLWTFRYTPLQWKDITLPD